MIHRDIKPENIMLTGGHAVVVDFGIARALDAAGAGSLTESGFVIGTPQYISPEQSGSGPVDHRSDQYSLACTLFEMLVGQPPFTGPTIQPSPGRDPDAALPVLQERRDGVGEQTILPGEPPGFGSEPSDLSTPDPIEPNQPGLTPRR